MTLNDLRPGEFGIITDMRMTGIMRRRLTDLGITAGTKISMIRSAPFGDPLEFSILGYNLSLRRSEAQNIIVEKTGDKNV